jgi:hypothetical protein
MLCEKKKGPFRKYGLCLAECVNVSYFSPEMEKETEVP